MQRKRNGCPQSEKITCEIRVAGQLSNEWSSWFEGLDIQPGTDLENEGSFTVLAGAIADQAALHGILEKIRDLNLKLISFKITGPRSSL